MKPILFNAEMVKAILEERKTATRRVIKDAIGRKLLGMCVDGDKKDIGKIGFGTHESGVNIIYKKPPYQVGDVLYVRETWFYASCANCDGDIADGVCSKRESGEEPTGCYFYKADNNNFEWDDKKTHWKPSIHMPKEAARIFLKVTDVRVERLNDITEEQACDEGINVPIVQDMSGEMIFDHSPIDDFAILWDSTIKKKDLHLYGWDANPYVWVIEFERCKKPESEGT